MDPRWKLEWNVVRRMLEARYRGPEKILDPRGCSSSSQSSASASASRSVPELGGVVGRSRKLIRDLGDVAIAEFEQNVTFFEGKWK